MENPNQSSDQRDLELLSRAIRDARIREQVAARYSLKDDFKVVQEKTILAFSKVREHIGNRLGRPFRF